MIDVGETKPDCGRQIPMVVPAGSDCTQRCLNNDTETTPIGPPHARAARAQCSVRRSDRHPRGRAVMSTRPGKLDMANPARRVRWTFLRRPVPNLPVAAVPQCLSPHRFASWLQAILASASRSRWQFGTRRHRPPRQNRSFDDPGLGESSPMLRVSGDSAAILLRNRNGHVNTANVAPVR